MAYSSSDRERRHSSPSDVPFPRSRQRSNDSFAPATSPARIRASAELQVRVGHALAPAHVRGQLLDGLLGLALVEQDPAELAPPLAEGRRHLQRRSELGEPLLLAPHPVERERLVAAGEVRLLVEHVVERGVELGERLGVAAGAREELPEVVVRLGERGPEREGAAVVLLGLVGAAEREVEHEGAAAPGLREAGRRLRAPRRTRGARPESGRRAAPPRRGRGGSRRSGGPSRRARRRARRRGRRRGVGHRWGVRTRRAAARGGAGSGPAGRAATAEVGTSPGGRGGEKSGMRFRV